MADDKTHDFKYLMEKYRSNSLTAEEFQEFIQWLGDEANESEEVLENQSRRDWQGSKVLLREIQKHQKKEKQHRLWRRLVWQGAAALVILCLAWALWPEPVPEDLVFSTRYGETRDIELPDGSRVLLNANSSITWEGDWAERRHRSVELTGEAFFEVVRTGGILFEVTTPHVKIDVLGTEFNVKSRGGETDVFLQSGKVHLDIEGDGNQTVEMEPGDFVQYDILDKSLMTTAQNRLEEKASWVDGRLEFQNKSVLEILKEFEDLYGKTFRLDNGPLLEKRMDLSLPYADWDLVRKALEIALDVEFSTSRDTIIVK